MRNNCINHRSGLWTALCGKNGVLAGAHDINLLHGVRMHNKLVNVSRDLTR